MVWKELICKWVGLNAAPLKYAKTFITRKWCLLYLPTFYTAWNFSPKLQVHLNHVSVLSVCKSLEIKCAVVYSDIQNYDKKIL